MKGRDFMDEIDCGSFFDQIDDIIDFPADNGLGSGNCTDFPSIWGNPPEALPCPVPILAGNNSNSASDLSAELSVPYEDIVQLEWLSNFVEDSFSGGGMTLNKENTSIKKELPHNRFQTSSPVSVLESSSSSTSSSSAGGKTMPPPRPTQRGPHRARSKRPRPATFNPRPAIHLVSPTSSESENFAESRPISKTQKAGPAEHKKKIKMLLPSGPVDMNPNPNPPSVRKCMHCEITKTPQWRAGPMGPKTLCNACGVRYKSGRLFPEYRPAASPTFVSSLHSNSHKKVLEMRSIPTVITTSMVMTPTEPELIPNKNTSPDYI